VRPLCSIYPAIQSTSAPHDSANGSCLPVGIGVAIRLPGYASELAGVSQLPSACKVIGVPFLPAVRMRDTMNRGPGRSRFGGSVLEKPGPEMVIGMRIT